MKVKADYFSNNEEMLAKLQLTSSAQGYDLDVHAPCFLGKKQGKAPGAGDEAQFCHLF